MSIFNLLFQICRASIDEQRCAVWWSHAQSINCTCPATQAESQYILINFSAVLWEKALTSSKIWRWTAQFLVDWWFHRFTGFHKKSTFRSEFNKYSLCMHWIWDDSQKAQAQQSRNLAISCWFCFARTNRRQFNGRYFSVMV